MLDYLCFKETVRSKGGIWSSAFVWFTEFKSGYCAAYRPKGIEFSKDDCALLYRRSMASWEFLDSKEYHRSFGTTLPREYPEWSAEELEPVIRASIADCLEHDIGYQKENDGTYRYDLYADYRDSLSDRQVSDIVSSDDPDYRLFEILEEAYREARFAEEDRIVNAIAAKLEETVLHMKCSEDQRQQIMDAYQEVVVMGLPEKHYLDQEVYVNIFVDSGDGNYDYVCNHVFPAYLSDPETEIRDEASLVLLASTQGYSKAQLQKALRTGDTANPKGFLESVCTEVANVSTHMNCLVFLVRMSLRDLIALNELIATKERDGHFYDARKSPDCGMIIISKRAETGLYDPWNGGGSLLEIQLEKDVELPVRYIRSALPDGMDGYSISSVYGLCGSAWRSNMIKELVIPRN